MNDSRDFQDAESIRSGNSHVTSRTVSFPPHQFLEELLECRAEDKGRQAFETHGISGNVLQIQMRHLHTLSAGIESMEFQYRRAASLIHSGKECEAQDQDQGQRCQSGQSAKNSVTFSGGDSSKNYGADQQRLQISDLHFDKFPTSHVCLLEDKVQDRGMYLFTISYGS